MLYSFCIDDKFNLITIPKNGCTQIIKYISEYFNIFNSHKHSFTENICTKYENIHNCGKKMSNIYKYNPNIPTYLISRPIEEKVLSYFKANYYHHKKINDNPTFTFFVDNLHLYYKNDIHHLDMISNIIIKYNIHIDHLLDLRNIESNLTNLFYKYGIQYKFIKKNIINSTTKNIYNQNDNTLNIQKLYNTKIKNISFPVDNKLFFNNDIINKIKNFYKNDLQYYPSLQYQYPNDDTDTPENCEKNTMIHTLYNSKQMLKNDICI